ncbi:MAG: nucleotidyltransferase domain-containing protein [Candidatus Thermoplasmatota archaeon]|jgi:uncharacterized protein|nr:nucleotidyltransferase domain-containing protein [Candidatus Thermoplasmatota archaeon]
MLTRERIFQIIHEHKDQIDQFGVKRIGLFGSFVNETNTYDSDVDLLVEFEKGKKSFDNYMDLKFFLERLFQRDVDLVIKDSVKKTLKSRILGSVEYAT